MHKVEFIDEDICCLCGKPLEPTEKAVYVRIMEHNPDYDAAYKTAHIRCSFKDEGPAFVVIRI